MLILDVTGWQRTRNEFRFTNNRDTNTINTAGKYIFSIIYYTLYIATTTITTAPIPYIDPTSIPSSSSKNDNDLNVVTETSKSNSFSNINVRKRTAIDSFLSPQKNYRRKVFN